MGAPSINPPTSRRIGASMGTLRPFFSGARMETSCLQWKSQVIWDTLQGITFNHNFKQSLDNICFPRSLQSLTFGSGYDQGINNVTCPSGLLSLTFGSSFNQSIDTATFPRGLYNLNLVVFSIEA